MNKSQDNQSNNWKIPYYQNAEQCRGLTAFQKLLIRKLIDDMNKRCRCEISNQDLLESLGCSPNTLSRAFQALEMKDIIFRLVDRSKGSGTERIIMINLKSRG